MKVTIEFEGITKDELIKLQHKILICLCKEYPDKILETTFIEDGLKKEICGVEFEEI